MSRSIATRSDIRRLSSLLSGLIIIFMLVTVLFNVDETPSIAPAPVVETPEVIDGN